MVQPGSAAGSSLGQAWFAAGSGLWLTRVDGADDADGAAGAACQTHGHHVLAGQVLPRPEVAEQVLDRQELAGQVLLRPAARQVRATNIPPLPITRAV